MQARGWSVAAYDYIVVGAGSAGCAVAGRLAAESSSRVLLIEAGGSDRRLAVRAPLANIRQFGTSLDWNYETDPERGCAARRIPLHAGRVLGGTSAMNMMLWVKGSDLDYDGWDLPGWSWQDVAPVFARIEQGPMRIGRTPYPDDLSKRFVAAARAAGVCADDDVSGPDLDGAAMAPVTIHNGRRWSAPRGYLQRRSNLTVLTGAEVHRVVIRNGRAVGVEYRRRGGKVRQVFADQQVVVSAGAYRTPHLLQLSGIGPADHLRGVGITPVVDSPGVGQGLTDHPHAWAIWSLPPGRVGLSDASNPKWLLQWVFGRRGKFANSIVEAVAHIRSTADLPACDFQLMTCLADPLADPKAKLKPALAIGHSYWTPKSRGTVLIRSSDPATPPAIRMNLLTERGDVDALVRAVLRTREIMSTEPIVSALGREILPGPGSDIEARIRETAMTTYHPSCTVAMGNQPDSPLDEHLRVRGVDNLRVADASALPRIPRANTNAASIMIGERCADFLLAASAC
ncbi:GMC family oxidoreductase [Mycobacterium paragordonae]|uniref:GMC family oxidoreductase n=1 Tax=Mycobacterium paragordonae TaxID=1389713 RepID=UPI002740FB9A|nr:GMC family oxidoreductase N-terminal domain-containing protein [Mycobacterium paragordonae]